MAYEELDDATIDIYKKGLYIYLWMLRSRFRYFRPDNAHKKNNTAIYVSFHFRVKAPADILEHAQNAKSDLDQIAEYTWR